MSIPSVRRPRARSLWLVAGPVLALAGAACARTAPDLPGAPVPARASARTPGAPQNGLEVVGWMRYAHPSRELRSLSFQMTVTEFGRDSSETRAHVMVRLPGRMRVAELPASRRAGLVRAGTRIARFEQGRRVASAARVDLAMLLAYDVFAQGVDTTIAWLDSARVRFGFARRVVADGRDVWIVGAEEGDTAATQFWVDADRWRVVRVIQRDPFAPSVMVETRFTHWEDVLDVPLPTRVEVRRNGRLVERWTIAEMSANSRLPSNAFDLSRWRVLAVSALRSQP